MVIEARIAVGPSSLKSLENSVDSLSGLILKEGILLPTKCIIRKSGII